MKNIRFTFLLSILFLFATVIANAAPATPEATGAKTMLAYVTEAAEFQKAGEMAKAAAIMDAASVAYPNNEFVERWRATYHYWAGNYGKTAHILIWTKTLRGTGDPVCEFMLADSFRRLAMFPEGHKAADEAISKLSATVEVPKDIPATLKGFTQIRQPDSQYIAHMLLHGVKAQLYADQAKDDVQAAGVRAAIDNFWRYAPKSMNKEVLADLWGFDLSGVLFLSGALAYTDKDNPKALGYFSAYVKTKKDAGTAVAHRLSIANSAIESMTGKKESSGQPEPPPKEPIVTITPIEPAPVDPDANSKTAEPPAVKDQADEPAKSAEQAPASAVAPAPNADLNDLSKAIKAGGIFMPQPLDESLQKEEKK